MADGIFAKFAPKYWDHGLSALPIKPSTKRPDVESWPSYQANLPSPTRRQEWLSDFPDHGIGVNTGTEVEPGKILVGIDVDDDQLVRMVDGFVGGTVCGKRGKKGLTIFALAPKDEKTKSTTLKGANELGNIDILAGGRQTVLPPTIHPDTGIPYDWIGTPLHEVEFGTLPVVDKHKLQVLEKAIGSQHLETLLTGKSTHDAGVAFTAELVAAGATDEEIHALVRGALPENYMGNSLKELPGWIESARKKGFDQHADDDDAKQSTAALKLIERVGYELFHNSEDEAFIVLNLEGKGKRSYAVGSTDVKSWIGYRYYKSFGSAIASHAAKEVVDTLTARARYECEKRDAHVRVAFDGEAAFVDLGRDDGRCVRIDGRGWEVVPEAPVAFWRPPGFSEIPLPTGGGDLVDLQHLLGLDDTNFKLVISFMLGCFNQFGPYLGMLPQGGKGSGKSMLSSIMKRLIDPSIAERSMLPRNEHDLAIQAMQHFLLLFDNVGNLKFDLSDQFCTILTGGAFFTRKYYTDNEARIIRMKRPILVNGIGDFANRSDLLERCVQIDMPQIPEGKRRTERQLQAEFDRIAPGFLGALYDCVSYGIAHLDDVVPPVSIRMADAAHFILACEPATGFEAGSLLRAIESNQHDMMTDRIVNDPLYVELHGILEGDPDHRFEGLVGELHQRLIARATRGNNRLWPTPARLSKHIAHKTDMLREAGLFIELGEKVKAGRMVRVWADDELQATFKDLEF